MTQDESVDDWGSREKPPSEQTAEEFRRLFDENYRYVWSSLRRLGVQERDLEDLTHDVFLEVHAKLATYDRARPIRPWLFAFALRFASDYRKLHRHKTSLHDEPDAVADEPSAEEMLELQDSARLLQVAMNRLSMDLRAVLVLHDIDETPMKDITKALEIPLNTGYSRLRLAREQCAKAVKQLTSTTHERTGRGKR